MWRLLLGTMGVKSLVQGLNTAATAGSEPRTVWSEVRRRNRLATAPPFQNALDHVWHDGLLYKLGLLGITPKSLQWLQSYLSNRSLDVNVNSSTSKDFPPDFCRCTPGFSPRPSPVFSVYKWPARRMLLPNWDICWWYPSPPDHSK